MHVASPSIRLAMCLARGRSGEIGVASQFPERGYDRTVGLDRRSHREHKRTATYLSLPLPPRLRLHWVREWAHWVREWAMSA